MKTILHMNSREEDLKFAKKLLKEYQAKGDQKNVEICLRNIKNFSTSNMEKSKNFGIQIQAWDWKTPVREIHDWTVRMSRENPNLKFYPIETHNDEYALAYSEQDIDSADAQRLYETCEEEKGQDEDHSDDERQANYEHDAKYGLI